MHIINAPVRMGASSAWERQAQSLRTSDADAESDDTLLVNLSEKMSVVLTTWRFLPTTHGPHQHEDVHAMLTRTPHMLISLRTVHV